MTKSGLLAALLWPLLAETGDPLSAAGNGPLAVHPHRQVPVIRLHRAYRPAGRTVRYVPIPEATEPVQFWVASSLSCPQSPRSLSNPCFPSLYAVGASGRSARVNPQQLCETLEPGVPVCIFVHGSFVWTPDFAQENVAVHRWLRAAAPGQPMHLICYRWPSESGVVVVPQVNVAVLGMRAEWNGYFLARLIQALPDETPVCLIGHSHGARLVASAAHLLGGGRVQGTTAPANAACPKRLRMIFLAGAVDHDWLNPGRRYGRALPVCEQFLNVVNREDIVLTVYPWKEPFGAPALGQVGLLPRDRGLLGLLSMRANQIDVTRLIGNGHLMPFYRNQPAIAQAIVRSVHFTDEIGVSPGPGFGSRSSARFQPSRRTPVVAP